jgi:hypothetical protein
VLISVSETIEAMRLLVTLANQPFEKKESEEKNILEPQNMHNWNS